MLPARLAAVKVYGIGVPILPRCTVSSRPISPDASSSLFSSIDRCIPPKPTPSTSNTACTQSNFHAMLFSGCSCATYRPRSSYHLYTAAAAAFKWLLLSSRSLFFFSGFCWYSFICCGERLIGDPTITHGSPSSRVAHQLRLPAAFVRSSLCTMRRQYLL